MERVTWLGAVVPLAAVLAGGGCSYNYRNPSETLRIGEVQGRTVAERPGAAGTFDPLAGVSVGLRNSGLAVVSRATGHFTYLDLPQGQHRLLFRKGTDQVLVRDVDVELGSDGQPQGILLGDVALSYTVDVTGSIRGSQQESIETAVVTDTATGAAVMGSAYSYTYDFPALAVGEHELRFGATGWDSSFTNRISLVGSLPNVLLASSDQRTTKQLATVTLHRATGEPGRLTFRLRIVGKNAGVQLTDFTLELQELVTTATSTPIALAPDSTGLVDRSDIPEGPYLLSVKLTDSASTAAAVMPPLIDAVVLAGDQTDLGDVYVVAQDLADQIQGDCRTDADCQPGGTCQLTGSYGVCAGWTPPIVLPPDYPACDAKLGACGCDPKTGACSGCSSDPCVLVPGTDSGYCVPCGTSCTPDGVNILDSNNCG